MSQKGRGRDRVDPCPIFFFVLVYVLFEFRSRKALSFFLFFGFCFLLRAKREILLLLQKGHSFMNLYDKRVFLFVLWLLYAIVLVSAILLS